MDDIIYRKVIPPNKLEYRDGFSNQEVLDSLTSLQTKSLINRLLDDLPKKKDLLIGKTLVSLDVKSSLQLLLDIARSREYVSDKILWLILVYKLAGDKRTLDELINIISQISNQYELVTVIHEISDIKVPQVINILEELSGSPNHLVSYNAKVALGYED